MNARLHPKFYYIIILALMASFVFLAVMSDHYNLYGKISHNLFKIIPFEPDISKSSTSNPSARKYPSISSSKLYIAVLDGSFHPNDYQCIFKSMFLDKLLGLDFIESVEWLSMKSWSHSGCKISPIRLAQPSKPIQSSSSWMIREVLKTYLDRSSAGWLFIISDSAYINSSMFDSLFRKVSSSDNPLKTVIARGSCIQYRYYFDVFRFSSGVFISRAAAEAAIAPADLWNEPIEVGFNGEATLANIFESINIIPYFLHMPEMMSNRMFYPEHLEMLKSKNFSSLGNCTVPESFMSSKNRSPGVCARYGARLKEVAIWSAPQDSNITDFLMTADGLLNNLPDEVGYYWGRDMPVLCNLSLK